MKQTINQAFEDQTKAMDKWYKEEFEPFKQQKEQQKQDFQEFSKIIINNTNEIKYMLSCIYDNKFENAAKTWNELNLQPTIKDIKLQNDNLIITDKKDKQLLIKFDDLLANIANILG